MTDERKKAFGYVDAEMTDQGDLKLFEYQYGNDDLVIIEKAHLLDFIAWLVTAATPHSAESPPASPRPTGEAPKRKT